MALPKEPRQKMINIMYLVLTAILALNVSAEILNAFKVVDRSLAKSNESIDKSNATLFKSLQDKMKKPETAEKATYWNGIAEKAKTMSEALYARIETYKDSLKRASGWNPEKGINEYKEDDLDAATRLFIDNKKGPELYNSLKQLKEDLLKLDPEVGKEFASKLPIDLEVPKSTTGSSNTWEYNYFHMTPTTAAITILSKFENDIKNAENQVVTYCHNKVGAVEVVYDKFQAIAAANSTYLMPGQELVVTAGVGAFNSQAKPTVSIDGASIPLNENGVAEKKFQVSGAGSRKVHVVINYLKPDGKPDQLVKDIEYTVGTPGGVAASADKMNVFYIGVENPITVGSPTGWDKTSVTMAGAASIASGSNGKYIVKGNSIGEATLSVVADGKKTEFKFRVKRIPDPVFKVGPSSGGAIQAAVFKSQQYCRAELENFDFDARFQVVGATVYFTGAGFPVPQPATLQGNNLGALAQMAQCKPGTSVIFDQIQVVGPDGSKRTITAPGFLLK